MKILKNFLWSGVDIKTSDDVNLDKVDPLLLSKLCSGVALCKNEHIDILITQWYRSSEYQDWLYAIWRTKPGKIVTNCRGWFSPHNYWEAIDFAPLESNGTINWNTWLNPKWRLAGILLESAGLTWGWRWTKFKDMPHLELEGASERAYVKWTKKLNKK